MLKYEVPDLTDVPEAHRAHYAPTEGGGFRLELDGYETPEQIREGLTAEKTANKTARAEFTRLEKSARESAQRQAEDERQAAQQRVELEARFDLQAEQENARKLAEYTAGMKAQLASMRADRARITLERTAHALAAKLAHPGCANLLVPHIAARLEGREENGAFVIGVKGAADLDALAEELRSDPAFRPAIRGASPAERAFHARRVSETLGVPASDEKPMTRAQFEQLSPERRAAHVRGGGSILDG